MRRSRVIFGAAGSVALAWLLASAAHAAGGGPIGPGSYCPLPDPGQKRECLARAEGTYGADVFLALDEGDVTDAQLARLEADVAAGTSADQPYLALSSLTYAYYRMAQRAASEPGEDPVVVARLERWNTLLAGAYESTSDADYRDAMRIAANDLRDRAPVVRLACLDDAGEPTECTSTDELLRAYDAANETLGIPGALKRIYERAFGKSGT